MFAGRKQSPFIRYLRYHVGGVNRRMNKVLYDSQTFTGQRFGGISEYFNTLITCHDASYEPLVSGRVSNNIYVPNFDCAMKPFFPEKQFKGKLKLMKFINRRNDKKHIQNESEYDLYHPTYYEAVTYPNNRPVVITAHDFISELFPQGSGGSEITEYKRESFRRADKIICISENTRQDLLKLFPEVDELKTELVYHALTWETKEPLPAEKPYILFTGVRNAYKNFPRFVRAVAPLLQKYDLDLLCSGHGFSEGELQMFEELGIKDRVHHKFAKDKEELQDMYRSAFLFVFPSLYEGFGFPILEAYASGCPIALSNTSCFPEIAGDAGTYFNPESESSIQEAVKSLIGSEDLRNKMRGKGYNRLSKFTVEKLIQNTAAVYKQLL